MPESRESQWQGWLWAAMLLNAPEGRVPPALFLNRSAAVSWIRSQENPSGYVIRKTQIEASFDLPAEGD